jgi:biopolymer transport protein ExbD
MRKPELHDSDSLEVKMTPMIDVVFLLLVFFVWTSSFELPEFDLPSAIAETPQGGSEANVAETPPAEVFDELIVKLLIQDATMLIEFNGMRMTDVDQLRARVAEVIALGVQPPVIVDPDDRVTMDQAIEVYDAVRLAGADRVLFAAHP